MIFQCGRFNSFLKSLASGWITGPNVTSTLEEHAAKALQSAMHTKAHPRELALLLGWSYSPVGLPFCGGFKRNGVIFLLTLLWEDRKFFLVVGCRQENMGGLKSAPFARVCSLFSFIIRSPVLIRAYEASRAHAHERARAHTRTG
jgi:hypothetical protein